MSMSFQETIRRETERRGLSGYALGKLANVPIRTVQEYLAGGSDLAGRRIEKLAAALGLELRPAKTKSTKRAQRAVKGG